MTISKFISKIFPNSRADVIEQGAEQERKKRKDTKLVDLAHEALVRRAAGDRADLEALVKMGWPHVKRERFKSKVRKKVGDVVKEDFGCADAEMVDEITDSIVEVSEVDSYYKELFDKEEA